MRSVRAMLNLAPKTVDEDYDARRREMKELGAALVFYEKAAAASKRDVSRAVDAMSSVQRSLGQMVGLPSTATVQTYTTHAYPHDSQGKDQDSSPKKKQQQQEHHHHEVEENAVMPSWAAKKSPNARELAIGFAAACNRVKDTYHPQYVQAIDIDVLLGVAELKKMHDACRRCAAGRNKVCRAFDVCRHEVAQTERRYAAKGKDLATSRSYSVDVAQRNALRSQLQCADASFKRAHDRLMQAAREMTAKCMAAFIRSSTALSGSVACELEAVEITNNEITTSL